MPEKRKMALEVMRAAGLAALLAMVGWMFPLPGKFLANLVWAVPIILLLRAYPIVWGLSALLLANGFMALVTASPLWGAVSFLEMAPVALVYGIIFKKKIPSRQALLIGCGTAVLSTLLAVALYLWGSGLNLPAVDVALRSYIPEILKQSQKAGYLDTLAKQGITEGDFREFLHQSISIIERLFPGLLATLGLWTGFFNYFFTDRALERRKLIGKSFPPFVQWQLPWYVIWGFILGLGLTLVGDQFDLFWAIIIGDNLLFIYFPIFTLLGWAVGVHFYREVPFPLLIKRIILLILLLNIQFTVVILFFMGLFDNVFNLRRFKYPKPDNF